MKKRKLITALLAAALAVSMAACAGSPDKEPTYAVQSASVQTAVTDAGGAPIEVSDTYIKGDTLDLPGGRITADGQSYDAVPALTYPSGKVFGGARAMLSEAGQYKLTYRAVANGTAYTNTQTFVVHETLYEISGSQSTARYGAHERYTQAGEGLLASVILGEQLNFNVPIDLTGKTAADPVVSFKVLPESVGTPDASEIVLTLTDLYDAENKIEIRVKKVAAAVSGASWAETGSFLTANCTGQQPTGLEANTGPRADTVWNGSTYILHAGDSYGAAVNFSMPGTPRHPTVDAALVGMQTLTVSFDYAERRVYANNTIIVDLDDAALFSSRLWSDGFSDGKCLLSVKGASYRAAALNIMMTYVDGNDLTNNTLPDTDPPDITVLADGVPDASVGKPFALPQATAADTRDRTCEVSAVVYQGYGTNVQGRVAVTDGKFTPSRVGLYTVVYTASDRAGNTTTKIYPVNAAEGEQLRVTLGERQTQASVGTLVSVPLPVTSGVKGDLRYTVTVTGANHTLDATNGSFRPIYAGEYQVTYTVSDYIDTVSESYTVTVTPDGAPIFLQDAVLPKYILRNCKYDTPTLVGYVFENGQPVEKTAELYIVEDGKQERKHTASKLAVNAEDFVRFIIPAGRNRKDVRRSCGGRRLRRQF